MRNASAAVTTIRPSNNRWSSLPRADHLERHVQPQDRATYALLCETLTLDEIAQQLGITRRMVEYGATRVAYAIGSAVTPPLSRLRMLRIAIGLEPCWCEQ